MIPSEKEAEALGFIIRIMKEAIECFRLGSCCHTCTQYDEIAIKKLNSAIGIVKSLSLYEERTRMERGFN